MTVRVERAFELSASPEAVWEFIADPESRARAISVVREYTTNDSEGRRVTWEVELPIPLVRRTATVETEDLTRQPPEYVEFVGRSKVMQVTGEHEIVETEGGVRLENRFVVDGKLPGVEKYFERNLDDEIGNLQRELERHLEAR
ncbi:SRPBCC family protein [Halobiforma nitratireducens]|uniref:Polyketide cyclase/dehydrase n=1 Tax=Halobiforma nitratireducens JCM 10879 TaxID=1227454 RepID=M0M3R2_9EURY|nr:SRPBCC family protein [Halobiforma nitratireducens]EMA40028.1 polyketide cyclase/dehydrase [Halobiforma nitratireducens JCM 10879]